MGAHSKHIPKGRTVYVEKCYETYYVPDGEPDIMSVDDLKYIEVYDLQNLPGDFFIDDDCQMLRFDKVGALELKKAWICPDPSHEGCFSADREDFVFEDTWECTDCGDSHDTEEEAEQCCARQRELTETYATKKAKEPTFLIRNYEPPSHSFTDQQLVDEIKRRGGQLAGMSSDGGFEITFPNSNATNSKEDWGLT